MPQISQELDLNLCCEILLRIEEVLENSQTKGQSRGPSNYTFEGYSPEIVEFNIRKMHDSGLIRANRPKEMTRDTLRFWPVSLYRRGLAFLELARDENDWEKALEVTAARGDQPTIKTMKLALLECSQQGSVYSQ